MAIAHAWESLRGDPMPWLLDDDRPNVHWRVLVELLRRPVSSPAVIRACGGADAAEPIASLLAELDLDGGWATDVGYWKPYSGPGWRLVAAVQLGADPPARPGPAYEWAVAVGDAALRHRPDAIRRRRRIAKDVPAEAGREVISDQSSVIRVADSAVYSTITDH